MSLTGMIWQRCARCGEAWWDAHVCPQNRTQVPFVATPTTFPLTEDDVRRIVREELAKLSEGGS